MKTHLIFIKRITPHEITYTHTYIKHKESIQHIEIHETYIKTLVHKRNINKHKKYITYTYRVHKQHVQTT